MKKLRDLSYILRILSYSQKRDQAKVEFPSFRDAG
jgi:hypothetical protein